LKSLLEKIDCLIINDEGARLLADDANLIKAADEVLKMGPEIVIVKKGESGSFMAKADGEKFILPGYPAEIVKDPTGAGDSFAGGFMGYLAAAEKIDIPSLKKAIACGTVVASYTVADFSLQRLSSLTNGDIDKRLETLRHLTSF
jgi:sugar/nucleoside kinase (ribokinase family)